MLSLTAVTLAGDSRPRTTQKPSRRNFRSCLDMLFANLWRCGRGRGCPPLAGFRLTRRGDARCGRTPDHTQALENARPPGAYPNFLLLLRADPRQQAVYRLLEFLRGDIGCVELSPQPGDILSHTRDRLAFGRRLSLCTCLRQ